MTVRLSNSEIQTFKDCRRRWWLSYYRRMKPKQKDYSGALALGTRVHAALDDYYANGTPLLESYSAFAANDRLMLEAEMRDTTAFDSEAELGRIMLEGYLEWVEENGIDSELDIISTEEIITVPLFNGDVELTGKLDMRVRRKIDGTRAFRDFKTVGGSLSDFANLAPMNEQILTYMILEMLKDGEDNRSDGAIFTLLKKVKRSSRATPPFYDQIEVRHNIFTVRNFWNRLHGTLTDLMRVRTALDNGEPHTSVAYPHPTRDCKWKCPFFSICPMFDDGSSAEQALTEMFEENDPYAYYNSDPKGLE